MTPTRWIASVLPVAALLFAVVGAAALGLAQRVWLGSRVEARFVTGRAAAAIGDSGRFASPVLTPNEHPIIPHADAESVAVAVGYFAAPSYQDLSALPEYKERPLEHRHFCGRSYYVRPIAAMPDTNRIRPTVATIGGCGRRHG